MRGALPRTLLALVSLVLGGATPSCVMVDDPSANGEIFSAALGLRRMESGSAWAPNDDLPAVALGYQVGPPGSQLAWDFGLRYAGADGSRRTAGGAQPIETEMVDATVGGMLFLASPPSLVLPYAGAGVALIWAGADLLRGGQLVDDQDGTFGGYFRAGFLVRFDASISAPPARDGLIGLDLTVIAAPNLSFLGDARPAGSATLSLLFGYRF